MARLDSDDIAHGERLQRQLAYLDAHPSLSLVGGSFQTFKQSSELGTASAAMYTMPCHPLLVRWRMLFGCSLAHPTVTLRRSDFAKVELYPEEEAEDHCCWLGLPLGTQFANTADVVCYLRRHPGSRSNSSSAAITLSSYRAVRRFLSSHCDIVDCTDDDVGVLWGTYDPTSASQAQRVSRVLDTLEELFLRLLGDGILSQPFIADFVGDRRSALQDYFRSSCSKLRGALAMQSLARGDVSSGAEMMKLWLSSSTAPKSLGALIGAGFTGDS